MKVVFFPLEDRSYYLWVGIVKKLHSNVLHAIFMSGSYTAMLPIQFYVGKLHGNFLGNRRLFYVGVLHGNS